MQCMAAFFLSGRTLAANAAITRRKRSNCRAQKWRGSDRQTWLISIPWAIPFDSAPNNQEVGSDSPSRICAQSDQDVAC